MEKSKLITIFNTFSKKEVRDLRKWLQSPVHNQRADVVTLFEILAGNGSAVSQNPDKEHIFQALFPNQPYDDARFRQTTFFLLKAIEEFLIYQEQRGDEVRSLTALARVYRKRKLEKLFYPALAAAKAVNDEHPFRNESYQRNEFLMQLEELAFVESQKRTVKMNLQEVANTLEITFLADKLRYSCLMLAHQAVYKTDYDMGMIQQVLQYVEEKNLLEIPAIAVYYYGYKANTERANNAYFQNLKTAITQFGQLFPASELRDIYLMTINYLISRMNAGDDSIASELFDFYKNGLEQQFLLEDDSLSRFTFRNIVSLGLKLGEFAWVEKFIIAYQKHLEEKHRESIVHFSLANLAFEKRDYKTAMRQLMQVEYDDILMNLNAKRMLIKMFYEEEEADALDSLLDSLRTYMLRKKVMGYHKASVNNFIRLTKRLLKVTPYGKLKDQMRGEIQAMTPLVAADREWLLGQLKE